MSKKEIQSGKAVQTRMSGQKRRLEIARVAAKLFAAEGFTLSTRKISAAMGISQAALYKHFNSKAEIIEEVFRVGYLEEKPSQFGSILSNSDGDLVSRLSAAYLDFFNAITETSIKLFHRASYDGLEIAKQYSPHLDERILWPVLESVRIEAGMAPLEKLPATRDERELALMLHSTIVFLSIRKHVYRIEFEGYEPHLIHEYITVWLTGALVSVKRYHSLG